MAEMVPVEFWHRAIGELKRQYPQLIFVAEIYNPSQYRLYADYGGFDYLYDKVGLYDTLREVICNDLPAKNITYCWQNVGDISDKMVNFLENHDEQRIASDFFASRAVKAIPALIVSAMMNTNPFMLYAGQELGERGMDDSGFSGVDGRSSIFDYYQPDTLRRWINGGKYDFDLMSADEKSLRDTYKRVLTLCNSSKALSEGLFYDLTYANIENPDFNSERSFAFLRKCDEELLLIVANFADNEQHLQIIIPQHAFDFLHITPQDNTEATDLLTGGSMKLVLSPHRAMSVDVEAFCGIVLKIR